MHARRLPLLLALVVAASLLALPSVSAQVPPVGTTPAPDAQLDTRLEAEDLEITTPDAPASPQGNCCSNRVVWSGNQQLWFRADAEGEQVGLAIEVPRDGTYELFADITRAADYGIFQLAVDGVPVGEPYDAYSGPLTIERRARFGTVELTAGRHELTATTVGTNPASVGPRYFVGLDVLRFRFVPEPPLALSPAEGAAVAGAATVYGLSGDPGDALDLAVDGLAIDDRSALPETVLVAFEANGLQSGSQFGFRNVVRVGGREFPLTADVGNTTTVYGTVAVEVPGSLLTSGENTVTIAAGTEPDATSGNHDDFSVRNVRLELLDGTVLRDPDQAATTALGDGCCPDPASTLPRSADFTFAITSAQASARAIELDTTTVDDGSYTAVLSADGPSGARTERHTFLVDNTAPAITATSPADGGEVKGEVVVGVTATDGGSGVTERIVTLDGAPVAVGSTISSDVLAPGSHELTFTVVDAAGNTAVETATITSVPERPAQPVVRAPADGAEDVPTDAPLRVTATDPAGDPLEVTFLEATRALPVPGRSWTGVTQTAPPAQLAPGQERRLPRRAVNQVGARDGQRAATGEVGDGFPYQRFDLALGAAAAGRQTVEVSWDGRTDPGRQVALSVYDVAGQAWVEVAGSRGDPTGDVALTGTVALDRFRDGDVVHVLVQALDPFADDIEDPADGTFRDPDTYDFSLAWMTDTQYLSQGAANGATAFAEAYRDINEWVVANAADRKIAYSAHTGDLIETYFFDRTLPQADVEQAEEEFAFASETMGILDEAGMPYGVTPGNHDNGRGVDHSLYNRYFGPERFESATARASQDYYGGPWRPGDNQNHYDLFTAGGQDFIVVYLGYVAGDEEIAWANEVLAEHRDRKAIFATHEYLLPSSDPRGRGGPVSDEGGLSQGEEFFQQVILPNENVFLTLSGHTHGVALNIKRDVGEQGRTVVEMLANYQFFQVEGERRVGHFRLLQFDLDRGEVSVNTYSPTLDDHHAEEFDTDPARDYVPAADEFTVPVDLNRTTTFATDAVGLDVRSDRVIGSDAIASGGEAAVTWEDLEGGRSYAWYARADDGRGGVAESEVSTFTTADGPGPSPGRGSRPRPGGPPRPGGARPGESRPAGDDSRDDDDEDGPGDDEDRPGDDEGRPGPTLRRLWGPGRTETALEISRATFDDGAARGVVLARPDVFPDALAGGPLAEQETAPLLLTGSDGLEPAVAEEIVRVLPAGGTVSLLGGVDALAQQVADDVEALGFDVVRHGGPNRFATAAVIAAEGLGDPGTVILADGADFPDAVSAGAAAGAADAAVLLTGADTLPAETAGYLRGTEATWFAVGGPAAEAVPDAVPLVGATRIETSVLVAEAFFDDPTAVGIATGADFPDALAGGPAIARAGGPLLLTFGQELDPVVARYLSAQAASVRTVMLFGGPEALSDEVADGAMRSLDG